MVAVGHALGLLVRRAESTGVERGEGPLSSLLATIGARLDTDPLSGPYLRLGAQSVAGSAVTWLWVLLVFLFCASVSAPFIYFQF